MDFAEASYMNPSLVVSGLGLGLGSGSGLGFLVLPDNSVVLKVHELETCRACLV